MKTFLLFLGASLANILRSPGKSQISNFGLFALLTLRLLNIKIARELVLEKQATGKDIA